MSKSQIAGLWLYLMIIKKPQNIHKQERIPVGCVPPASVLIPGGGGVVSAWGCLPPGGGVCLEGCLPGEVSAWGGGGCLPVTCDACWETNPFFEQNDTQV